MFTKSSPKHSVIVNKTLLMKSNDPQEVLGYMEKNQGKITKDLKYIPQLVRVLEYFHENTKVVKQTLTLLINDEGYTNNYASTLYNESGLTSIVEVTIEHTNNLEIALLSLRVLEESSHHDACDIFFSDIEVLRTIVMTMTTHMNTYTDVCIIGLNIFLNILERNKHNTNMTNVFEPIEIIKILSSIIKSLVDNKKDFSKPIKFLSLFNLPDGIFEKYKEDTINLLVEIFEGIIKFTEHEEEAKQPQEFIKREAFLYTLLLITKMNLKDKTIQKHIIDLGYLSVLREIILRSLQDEEILIRGSQTILSFDMMDKGTKKVVSETFFDVLIEIFLSKMHPGVYVEYLKVLNTLIKGDTDFSANFFKSSLMNRIMELMKENPKDKAIQEQGLNVITSAFACSPNSINDINDNSINIFKEVYNAVEEYPEDETINENALLLTNILNKVRLRGSNIVAMLDILCLSTKVYDKADKELEDRYEEFKKISDDMHKKIDRDSGGKVFIESMKIFSSNRKVVCSCLTILADLLRLKNNTLDNFNKWRGVKSVLGSMSAFSKISEIQVLCCSIFSVIQSNSDCVKDLHDENGIEAVVSALNHHVSNESVQQCGSYLIALYAQSQLFKQKLNKEDVLSAIDMAFKKFPQNSNIQNHYCLYLSMLSPSGPLKHLVKKLGCQKNVLKILTEKEKDFTYGDNSYSFCSLVTNFDMVDIPGEESIGINTSIDCIKAIESNSIAIQEKKIEKGKMEKIKKGVSTILKILKYKSAVQNDIDKYSFVRFIFHTFTKYGNDSQITKDTEGIFSLIDFVQDKDTSSSVEILGQVNEVLGRRDESQKEEMTMTCLILLSKLVVLSDVVGSPLIEQTVKIVLDITMNKNYDILTQVNCLQILGAIGYRCGSKLRQTIIDSGVVWSINALNFSNTQYIENTFTFILGMEKFNYAIRNKMCEKYIKSILDTISSETAK